MKNVLVSSFFGFILLYSFNGYLDKRSPVTDFIPQGKQLFLNPLDAILGDKRMDDGSLRKDNFQMIRKLRVSCLKDSSRFYSVRKLTDHLFLVTRRQFYFNNRRYSLFLRTKGDRIVFCHVINDFPIRRAIYSDGKIYFVSDDYTEIASPWRPTYTIRIVCCDPDFKKMWELSSIPNKGYFFYGESLLIKNNRLIVRIGIQNEGSSTMCIDKYDLTLTKSGKLVQSVYAGGYGCGGKNVSETADLSGLFRRN